MKNRFRQRSEAVFLWGNRFEEQGLLRNTDWYAEYVFHCFGHFQRLLKYTILVK